MHKIRKNFTVIVFLLIFFTPVFYNVNVFGADNEYDIVAENFLKYLNSDKKIISTQIIEGNQLDSIPEKVDVAYLANLKNGGYVLVSTSGNLTPIKAYSLSGDFRTLPEAYKKFLLSEMKYNVGTTIAQEKIAQEKIAQGRTTQAVTVSQTQKSWDFLLNFEKARTTLAYTPDTYLLTTQWNQNYPYNKFLPKIDDQNVVSGCVNIAMAQIMKYHNCPAVGTGVNSFKWNGRELKAILYRTCNWDNMPDVLDTIQPEYKVDEVALLIRDLAIMNHTNFGLNDSSAFPAVDALIENFGYSNNITSINNSDVELFFNILKSEIDAERPVLLSFPGHMTVADGYSSDITGKKIHVNMGWGGHCDDYYLLDSNISIDGETFYSTDSSLTIYYNIVPCNGADCFVNLELNDNIDDLNIAGEFDNECDIDEYELYLKGDTTITGIRTDYNNQAFFISIYDSSFSMIVSSDQAISQNLPAGQYTVKISLCGEESGYTYNASNTGYTASISTDILTDAEKTEINDNLDILPVINSSFRDILLNSSNQEPYRILIDARDENGDVLNLSVSSSNDKAVQTALSGNILSLIPVVGASHVASRITVTATAGNKTAEKSFVVMISDEDISFGKEFIVSGIFEDQDDFNTHKIVPDGNCTISGYNGYSNQGFYSSVKDTYENIIVPPTNSNIDGAFASNIYLLCASLTNTTSIYEYKPGENDQYQLTVSCPDANDSTESIAAILGIDLSGAIVQGDVDNNGTVELDDAILSIQINAGIVPVSTVHHEADVNGDNRIGIEESIYILQKVSGFR